MDSDSMRLAPARLPRAARAFRVVNARDILQAAAAILTAQGHRAYLLGKVNASLEVDGAWAAKTDCGKIWLWPVKHGDETLMRGGFAKKGASAEDLAVELRARALLAAAVEEAAEEARRAALTPEQRAAEDNVCAVCDLRAPFPGLARCGRCVEKAA